MTVPNAFNRAVSREGRNEFQVLIAVMCALTGSGQVILGDPPQSLATLPHTYQLIWSWSLFVGGLFVLGSAVWHEAEGFGLFLEMSGLLLIGFTCLAYGLAILFTSAIPAQSVGGPILLAVALACFSRTYRVARAVFKPREEKLKEEVKARIVKEADVAAEQLVRESRNGITGEIPIARPRDDTSEGE